MGHIHLGVLPRSKPWREVVELLGSGAADDEVIAASAIAAERELRSAADDPLFVEAVRLLAMVPVAARQEDFGRALREAGIPAGDHPDLLDLVAAVGQRLEQVGQDQARRTDFGELARRALLGTLSLQIGNALPGLFDATAGDVQTATRRLSGSQAFAAYARGFFGRLVNDSLRTWLDRELSTHVGPGKRFADVGARSEFDAALEQYCHEATRIIREFTGGWFSKTLHREGRIDTHQATVFGAVACKKITEELKAKRRSYD